jgi:two-component system phosphate regulon sensor histidine kinase PhoR
MKDLTPNGIALKIAVVVAIAITLLVFVLEYLMASVHYSLIAMVFPVTFIASYIGFRIAVEKFVYKKIKIIYRTIHSLKLKKGEEQKEFSLNQIQTEVEDWDKLNKKEIDRLKGLESYRREFVGNVSHELKTPIFNIQGYLLTLLEGGLDDPNINVKYLEKANKGVDRMIALIEDLDEISQLESGRMSLNIKKTDLRELINEVLNSLEMSAKTKNITLKLIDDPLKPIWVMADAQGINQTLVNLVVNAIKYGRENGETLVRLHNLHDNILVEVADDGKGIAEKHLPHLFERFYRTDKNRGRDSGGTGLGLSIAKHIIEAHHQTISVRSSEGVGSTFSFTLKKA